ncbi:MAG: hypothetical protein FWG34_10485 [Oscillospiraceae bacterium]|nr:hypothetical protein [Oscillospiraceae bacterium]
MHKEILLKKHENKMMPKNPRAALVAQDAFMASVVPFAFSEFAGLPRAYLHDTLF